MHGLNWRDKHCHQGASQVAIYRIMGRKNVGRPHLCPPERVQEAAMRVCQCVHAGRHVSSFVSLAFA